MGPGNGTGILLFRDRIAYTQLVLPDHLARLQQELIPENARRLVAIASVGSAINLYVLLREGPVSSIESIIRLVWVLASGTYVILALIGLRRRAPAPAWLGIITTVATVMSLGFSVGITASLTDIHSPTFILIINLLLTSAFLTLSPRQVAIIFGPTGLLIIATILAPWPTALQVVGNAINMAAVCAFSIMIAFFNYRSRKERLGYQIQLEALADRDGLTGLANRHRLDRDLGLAAALSARGACPVAVLMIDLDDFKLYNDTWGHLAGDRVLQSVASTLQSAASRRSDTVGRFGGEEFMVIMACIDADGAQAIARTMIEDMSRQEILHDGKNLPPPTISIGIAWAAGGDRSLDATTLTKAADKALYEAKTAGKNRLVYRELVKV